MKIVDSRRRQIVFGVLLALAVAGAVIRYSAPDPSVARDVGTLLMVMWLPAVGNLVAFVIRRIPRPRKRATDFEGAFTAHAVATLTGVEQWDHATHEKVRRRCTLIAGSEGFTARLLPQAGSGEVQIEYLRADYAVQRLPAGSAFAVFLGSTPVAQGRIKSVA